MKDVVKMLNDLAWKADTQIDYLNWGGCGVFAALVGRKLQDAGIPVGVVCGSWRHAERPGNVARARSNVSNKWDAEEWNENGVYFGHVGLEVEIDGKLYHYDSNGVKPAGKLLDGLPIADGRVTIEEMELLAGESLNWNSEFPREQIPRLTEIVEKAFAN